MPLHGVVVDRKTPPFQTELAVKKMTSCTALEICITPAHFAQRVA
jgi:hypothetical protein